MVIRVAGWAITFLAWTVGTATVFAGLIGWALAGGGIAITAAVPYVERALTPADGRFKVQVAAAHLHWDSWRRAPNIRAAGVRVKGPDGEAAALPELAVGFSAGALLRGALVPTRIALEAPRLEVVRRKDGGFGLRGIAVEHPFALDDERPLPAIVQAALAVLAGSPAADDSLGRLDEVRVVGGRVLIDDQMTGLQLAFENASLTLARSPTGVSGRLALELEQADAPAVVRAVAEYRAADGAIELEIGFEDVQPAGFAALAPELPLDHLDLRLNGRLEIAVDAEGRLAPVAFEVASAAGGIGPFALLAEGAPVEWAWLRGSLDGDLRTLRLDELDLASGDTTLRARALVAWDEAPRELWVEASVDRLSVSELGRFWPPQLKAAARSWALANIADGMVRDALIKVHLGAADLASGQVADDAVQGRFTFDDLTVRYLATLPPATGIAGEGRFTANRLDFTLAEGQVGRLRARGGSVALIDIGERGKERVVVELDAAGPLTESLALIDRPPLGFAAAVGVEPATASGEAQATLRFEIPLVRDLTPKLVAVNAEAQLNRAVIRKAAAGADLTDGALHLRVDNTGLDLHGRAALAGVPVELTWHESFRPNGPMRRYRIAGRLSAADLDGLGVELGGVLSGDVGVEVAATELRSGRRADVLVDLRDAALTLPQLGWSKPTGAPGHLSFTATPSGDGALRIDHLVLSGPGLWIVGGGRLAAGSLRPLELDLERVLVGVTSTAIRWRPLEGGGHAVELDGEALDLRPLLDADHGGDGSAPIPLQVALRAERLLLPGGALHRVGGTLVRDEAGWRRAEVTATLATGAPIELRLEPETLHQRLTLRGGDAGELLRVAGLTSTIRRGALQLDARVIAQVPQPVGSATLRMQNFMVSDAPLLARVLTLASAAGIENLLAGRGIHFNALTVPFRFHGQGLQIAGAQASGSQLGLTLDGSIAADGGLNLRGTVVPLYDLNHALGQVPLLGTLLAGGGNGVFAAPYWVQGTRAIPEVGVNPLAVLAPGLVRKLVQGIIDGTHEPPLVGVPPYD